MSSLAESLWASFFVSVLAVVASFAGLHADKPITEAAMASARADFFSLFLFMSVFFLAGSRCARFQINDEIRQPLKLAQGAVVHKPIFVKFWL